MADGCKRSPAHVELHRTTISSEAAQRVRPVCGSYGSGGAGVFLQGDRFPDVDLPRHLGIWVCRGEEGIDDPRAGGKGRIVQFTPNTCIRPKPEIAFHSAGALHRVPRTRRLHFRVPGGTSKVAFGPFVRIPQYLALECLHTFFIAHLPSGLRGRRRGSGCRFFDPVALPLATMMPAPLPVARPPGCLSLRTGYQGMTPRSGCRCRRNCHRQRNTGQNDPQETPFEHPSPPYRGCLLLRLNCGRESNPSDCRRSR